MFCTKDELGDLLPGEAERAFQLEVLEVMVFRRLSVLGNDLNKSLGGENAPGCLRNVEAGHQPRLLRIMRSSRHEGQGTCCH